MPEFLQSVTERKSELWLTVGQLDRSAFEQPGPGLSPANTCGVSYWLAKDPREFRQLRWAVGMGDNSPGDIQFLISDDVTKNGLWAQQTRTNIHTVFAALAI